MPWREVSAMDQRIEFVALARQDGTNRRALCRRFGISAKTGYKWLSRAAAEGSEWPVPKAFLGERVALRPRVTDGRYVVFFGARQIAALDLRDTLQ
jgi:transposase-like protein